MQAIRSVLFTAFLMLSACAWGFAMALCFFLPQRKQFAMGRGWETIALFVMFPSHVWVLKHELLWIPFMGWGLKRLRPIAIDRGAGHRAVNQVIDQGKERLPGGGRGGIFFWGQ